MDSQIALKTSLKSESDIDKAINDFTKLIQNSVWNNNCPNEHKHYSQPHQLPSKIKTLIQERRQTLNHWQKYQ